MGVLVAFSGLDGSGKTTQGKLLQELCLNNGYRAVYMHLIDIDTESSLLRVTKEAKKYIKENKLDVQSSGGELRKIISALLLTQKVEREVVPALLNNDVVIVDRYIDSALCHHMLESGTYESTVEIYRKLPKADVNVYLNLPVKECLKRIEKRETVSEDEDEGALLKSYQFYLSHQNDFIWVDAARDKNDIAKEIFEYVTKAVKTRIKASV